MAKFRVKEKSFVNNAIREAGEVVDVDFGQDSDGKDIVWSKKLHANLEPVDTAKPKAKPKTVDAPEPDAPEPDAELA